MKNLCFGGGVALNGVANYILLKNGPFEKKVRSNFLNLKFEHTKSDHKIWDLHTVGIFFHFKVCLKQRAALKKKQCDDISSKNKDQSD